jgi:hypothetical protein
VPSLKTIPTEISTTATPKQVDDFSVVLGGPLFQIFRRAHLSGDGLELLRRRIVIITLFAWLPLLILSLIEGHALRGTLKIPFLFDFEANARFLVALPFLIIAEVLVHERLTPLVRRFSEKRIISLADTPAFNAAIDSSLRLRNSVVLEVTLLALVYTVGLWVWRNQLALGGPTWYAAPDATHLHVTFAGYWYAWVSIPIFQFLLLRWYFRLFIWFRLLWKVSRLNLQLSAAHPDRAGGIAFLGGSSYAFGPLLFAQGTLLSGLIANRVVYMKQPLLSFEVDATACVLFLMFCVLGPLIIFLPQLERAKRRGEAELSLLANRYVFAFNKKWIRGGAEDTEELLGTGDIQSLADLGNSFSIATSMRIIPFGWDDVVRLIAVTAAPLLPLSLTILSPVEIISRVVRILL